MLVQTIPLYQDEALKLEQLRAFDITRAKSPLWRFFSRSNILDADGRPTGTPISMPGGGKAVEFKLVVGTSASTGLPNGTDISGLGNNNEDPDNPVRITPYQLYSRTTIRQDEAVEAMNGGPSNYYNRYQWKLRGVYENWAQSWSAMHYGTGKYGQVATVTASQNVTSTSAAIAVEVDEVQRVIPSNDYAIVNSDGTPISGVGNCWAKKPGGATFGQGTVQFLFPNATPTPTIPIGAKVILINSAESDGTNLLFVNGMDEMVGDDPHPRSEGNNVQLDIAEYKSTVIPLGDGKLTWKALMGLLSEVSLSCVSRNIGDAGPQSQFFDNNGKAVASKFVWVMHPRTRDQLEVDLYDRSELKAPVGYLPKGVTDEGWVYDSFQGIPILIDPICPVGRVFLLHSGAFGRSELKPFGPLVLTTDPNFTRVSEKTYHELVRNYMGACVPIFRDCLGKITGTNLGMSLSDYTGVAA